MKKKYYITTPIYYVNDVPHIGHAYTTIAADVLARHHRLKGEDVFFLVGTDEHGQKVEQAAHAKGMPPQDYVDLVSQEFRKAWELLNIQYDTFIRTTSTKHKTFVVELIKKCAKAGDIYKGEYEGQYCVPCESYWTPFQLVNNNCPSCGRPTQLIKEDAYFFRLSTYQQQLLDYYAQNPSFLAPANRAPEIISRVKEGLKDLSITRSSFHWGIPFPLDKKHVTYVWFDALPNYLSALGTSSKKYWPADVHLVGKEINWFHSVIWPAMLFSAGIPPPKQVFAHGWLTVNGEKMSKSKGNMISPSTLAHAYGVDVTRYYLLTDIPFGQDGDFSEKTLVARANAELADALGNLLQRTLVLVEKHHKNTIPSPGTFTEQEQELIAASNIGARVDAHLAQFEFHRAAQTIWGFISTCNKYITATEPWKITDEKRRATILYCLLEALRLISLHIAPFMPRTAELLSEQIGQPLGTYRSLAFRRTTRGTVKRATVLFTKLSPPKKDPVAMLGLRVGKVLAVNDHPNAEKLYILHVDLGTEKRQLVAGLKPYLTKDTLKGKHLIIVTQLKPAVLRGVESNGMLLATEHNGTVLPLEAPQSLPGDCVLIDGVVPQTGLLTYDEFSAIGLTTAQGRVVYKKKPLHTDRETISVAVPDGATIR